MTLLTDSQWTALALGLFALALLSVGYVVVRGSLRAAAEQDWPSPSAMRARLGIVVIRRCYVGIVAAVGALVFAPSLLITAAIVGGLGVWIGFTVARGRREAARYPDRKGT